MKKKGKFLGEMLVSKGLLTEGQLQAVIEEQLRDKKFLGEMLVEKGIIDEKDLCETIAEQYGIEFISLKDETVDWDTALGFSSSIITKHKCLPLRADHDNVMVAIVNPLDVWVMEAVEKEAAPRKVKVALVTSTEMDAAVKEYHKHSIKSMVKKWKKD